MTLKEFEKKLLKNSKYKKASERLLASMEYKIGCMVFEARMTHRMTQKELAKKIGTSQLKIAEVENWVCVPSLKFLEKIAKVLGVEFVLPKFILPPRDEADYNNYLLREYKDRPQELEKINEDAEKLNKKVK